jgi:ferric-dicitrate binding protein FerR (iron transport regulator)
MTAGCVLLTGSAVAQVNVTSLQGTATAGGRPLSLHSEVGEHATVEVPIGARCSLLVADRALVQICGDSRASFSETRNGGGSIELNRGELKAIAPEDAAVSVQTPTASVVLRGAGAHISVAPSSGDTVISALDGQVSVSRRYDTDQTLVNAGQQVTLQRNQAPTGPSAVSRESLARNSACVNDDTRYSTALHAERAILIGAVPAVSAGLGDSTGHRTSDLQQIVKADFPANGLPLDGSATPSALVVELGKRGTDEEICDPITCNPVYRLDPPGPCGVPPVRPCTN